MGSWISEARWTVDSVGAMRYDSRGNKRQEGGWPMGMSSESEPERGNRPAAREQECWDEFLQQRAPIAAAIGLAAGLASGLLGGSPDMLPSPATAMLPALFQHRTDGAVLAMVQTAPVSALAYAAQGASSWPPTLLFSVTLAAFVLVGASATWRIPARQWGRGLLLFLLAVAARLLLG